MRDPKSSPTSLTERLARLFGRDVDPHVSLVADPVAGQVAAPTAEAVAQLLRGSAAEERYEIRGEIDRGGMGAVLDVWDRDLRRPLAMKVTLDVESERRPDGRHVARLLQEAQVTAQLDHPGIVPVHELGVTDGGRVFFTMRRVRGRDLREVLHCVHYGLDGWTEARALGVLQRVCEAVAFAHSRGVIHRDLKPANVMVGEFGEVYVMDWGLARVLGQAEPGAGDEPAVPLAPPTTGATALPGSPTRGDVSTLLGDERARSPVSPLVTSDGDVLGTPAYMPPEQAHGALTELSPRTDVYAVGAVLYHLLAHEPPYFPAGASTAQFEALESLRNGPPRPLAEVRAGIAPPLLAICERAMAFDPAQRYPDVRALSADLGAFLEQRVVAAYETGALAEARQWVRRNRPLATALAAAVAALVLGLAATGVQTVRAERSAALARREAQRADDSAEVARASAELAVARETEAREAAATVLRLADGKRLVELEREAEALWPALPALRPELERWLAEARALEANLPLHSATLAALRARALPYGAAERGADRAQHPAARTLAAAEEELEALLAGLDGLGGDALERAELRIGVLEADLARLEDAVEERRTWAFEDLESAWQHELLADLVAGLERWTEAPDSGADGDRNRGGALVDVEARLVFAQNIEVASMSGPVAAERWAEALALLEERDVYAGFELAPQVGLLPIGADPESGLLEFAHLASGAPAARDAGGHLVLREETGVVLVLLPAGHFAMGAQSADPTAPGFDPQATPEESPPRAVELDALFVSKYELTQAQWLRATGSNPSAYGPHHYASDWSRSGEPASLLHPVEQVSWTEATRVLGQLDLALPTEAQWEYAARAGTTSVWWTGDDVASLQGAGNVADRYGLAHAGFGWPAHERAIDDGYTSHAPVGRFRPNPFGLHDTIGNVFEWCGDGFGPYAAPPRGGDGARGSIVEGVHPRRGGGWSLAAHDARSACRNPGPADFRTDVLGLRPARALR